MIKRLENRLKNNSLHSDERKKKELIGMGTVVLQEKMLQRKSYLDLLVFTARFIKWPIWLAQLIILACSMLIILNFSADMPLSHLMKSLTGVLGISALFFLDELFKSLTSGMWELEQTFKYDLRQHTMMKLLIFGVVDLVLIIVLALLTNMTLSVPLFHVFLYLLVPYNLICITLLYFLAIWRRNISRHRLWFTAGIVSMLLFTVTQLVNIYQIQLIYWEISGGATFFLLIYMLLKNPKKLQQEVSENGAKP